MIRLENEYIEKKKVREDTLVPFGFVRDGNAYVYTETIADGKLTAECRIENRMIHCAVIDPLLDEEYLPVHMPGGGSYVSAAKEDYCDFLQRISDACLTKEPFYSEQANRLVSAIIERFSEEPDFPFQKFPDYGVIREKSSGKWYCLIMRVPLSKLYKKKVKEDHPVEILNLKINKDEVNDLLKQPGFFPSYHQKKDSWITILLDDTVPDETLIDLLVQSRQSLHPRAKTVSSVWIVPANPKYYDVDSAFRKRKNVLWKQSSAIHSGDTVCMYIASPVSAVRYICKVTETDIPFSYSGKDVSMKYVMRLDVIEEWPDDLCPFSVLKSMGINAVRGPRRANEAFIKLLESGHSA